jgi:translation initiation factor 2 subunit 1
MSQELPDAGEIVFATVSQITQFGAYVTLDEYNGLKGFLHISEVSTGWVRNIDKYIKPGQKVVLKVIRVNPERSEVDLSLRQVSNEEKKEKLIQIKRESKAKGILDVVKKILNMKDDSAIRAKLEDEYGTLYDALEAIAKKPSEASKLSLDKEYEETLVKVLAERFKLPTVEVKGLFEISSPRSDGVELIKNSFLTAMKQMPEDVKVEVTYGGAPRYYVKLRADNFKVAEKQLKVLVETVTKQAGKGGQVNFTREKS